MEYTTISTTAEGEFTEKRSRFIAAITPVTTEEEAQAFINQRKQLHWSASSTIYAYLLRQGGIRRYSDGGEPQGTGGIPVLDVIVKEGISDVCIVVSRYFGGTLLGAGGLVRAFTYGATLAISLAKRVTMIPCATFQMKLDYAQYKRVELLIKSAGGKVTDSDFGEHVCLVIMIPEICADRFSTQLIEATAATVPLTSLEKCYADSGEFLK